VIYGGFSGETPVAWRLARESHDPAELRKRYRQLGSSTALLNCVSSEWLEVRYGAFAWDHRMLRLYVDFCRRYLVERWHSPTFDYENGGLYLFDIAGIPRDPVPASVAFAPGIDAVYADATLRLTTGDIPGAIASYEGVRRRIPDVGQAWNKVGHALMTAGRPAEALPYLKKFGDAGMMDASNLPELYAAAVATGNRGLARAVLPELKTRYPTHPLTKELERPGQR
jgi:hypothetical protein